MLSSMYTCRSKLWERIRF